MKRRLAMRDRMVWLIAVIGVGVVVYLVLPIWAIAGTAVVLVGVPVLRRRRRRQRALR